MQFKQLLVSLALFLTSVPLHSQTTYLPQDARENVLLERLEIKLGSDSVLNFSKIKPYSRKAFITHLGRLDSLANSNPVDAYNFRMAMLSNLEWATGRREEFLSKRPVGKSFYQTPANLYEVRTPDFFLAVNPVVQYVVAKERDNDQHLFLNTRGVSLRGRIMDKIGFSAYVTDNQERDQLYVQEFEEERQAVPGAGFYKDFKVAGYDYFDARGQITFNVAKVIDVAFGFDRNFIGNGHRSLFLSDFSNSALFLKLNTRIWKFNYQNLFMELQGAERTGADILIPKKYAAMHHLDLAVTKWLNVGLFEGVVFGRKDHFEFGYLNPVIFYRSIEQQNGSFDNAVAGLDIKANVAKSFQFYSQFLLDEFNLTELRKGDGWWANKYALQLGAKYIDAFSVPNLDLQLELNRARPFTYSHRDSVANYTHYNQPLAHPLGANFNEWIALARYQPAPRWNLQAKAIYYKQGRDTGAVSFGSNIFLPNVAPFRTKDFGFSIGS
ncbi:MAG TPA: hypothetical protein VM843_00480, partial [Flavisolibacter sp.]|nr:hypothetical protein [Flavisolibacter sp.]